MNKQDCEPQDTMRQFEKKVPLPVMLLGLRILEGKPNEHISSCLTSTMGGEERL